MSAKLIIVVCHLADARAGNKVGGNLSVPVNMETLSGDGPVVYSANTVAIPELVFSLNAFVCLAFARSPDGDDTYCIVLPPGSRLALTSGSPGSGTLLDVARQRGSGVSPHSGVGLPERRREDKGLKLRGSWVPL